MKVLVDTSVWSLALCRRRTAALSREEQRLKDLLIESINDGRVAMLGIIRQELLSGIKEQAQFEKLKRDLDPFRDESIDTADHVEAARLFNLCRAHGIQAGTPDLLICTVAARRKWQLLSSDSTMTRCFEIAKASPRRPAKSV